jgi:hypothetical protein
VVLDIELLLLTSGDVSTRTVSMSSILIFVGAGVPITRLGITVVVLLMLTFLLSSGMLYSAGHTDDLRLALIYIQNRFPKAPLMGIGFSLGANIMSRYVAEEGTASRLRSGCAVGCVSSMFFNYICHLSEYSHGIFLRIIKGEFVFFVLLHYAHL